MTDGEFPFLDDDGDQSDEGGFESEFARQILDDLGIEDISYVEFSPEGIDPSQLRGQRFTSFEETVIFLYETGLITFGEIVYFPEDDLFGFAITYED